MLEVFNNLFMNIAEQMGLRLQNTAYSVNIKERLDFSCALFDADGKLIANAPHMPVHLGSMSESIKTVIARNPDDAAGRRLRAQRPLPRRHPPARRHGGDAGVLDARRTTAQPVVLRRLAAATTPTSAASRRARCRRSHARIDEEGVLFDNFLLVRDGQLREAELLRAAARRRAIRRATRTQNIADLRAQIAANEKGVQELRAHGRRSSASTPCAAYMRHVQDNAEESVRRVITALKDGDFDLPLDNGARIRVQGHASTPPRASATIDFTGTSAQLPNNFNAPQAVTMAAVLYVFRTLVDDDIPLNAGCLKPLHGDRAARAPCSTRARRPRWSPATSRPRRCVTNALLRRARRDGRRASAR